MDARVGLVDSLLVNQERVVYEGNATDSLVEELLGEKFLRPNSQRERLEDSGSTEAVEDLAGLTLPGSDVSAHSAGTGAYEHMNDAWLAKILEVPISEIDGLRWADMS